MPSLRLARPTAWLHAGHLAAATLLTTLLVGGQLLIAHRYESAPADRLAGRPPAARTAAASAPPTPGRAADAAPHIGRAAVVAVHEPGPTGR